MIAVLVSSALFLFAHLTGRVRRSTALGVAVVALATGAALAGAGAMEEPVLGPMAVPFGVFLMLAAGINGFVAFQAPRLSR
ncbi:hypothetical protein [Dongia deserti]|uniref:hypothetical protein n=1 Tax=Dongia deserti TaxID=2268030 RepID=UPI0013C4E7DE|nr:hypothetical protein [Dongia deserti]